MLVSREWTPPAEIISAMQGADLVVINTRDPIAHAPSRSGVDNIRSMAPDTPSLPAARRAFFLAAVGFLLAAVGSLSACRACGGSDPPEESGSTGLGVVAGQVDSGAVGPEGRGPWTLGVALFDEEALDPATMQALDEPELWTTVAVERLPAPFQVDIGAHFHGWLVVVLDVDGSGMPGTPVAGDLVGLHPTLVETPTDGLMVYLEEVWDR